MPHKPRCSLRPYRARKPPYPICVHRGASTLRSSDRCRDLAGRTVSAVLGNAGHGKARHAVQTPYAGPRSGALNLSYIDRYCQLERKQVNDSLRLMYTYGVVESFSLEDEQLRASLSLSLLQRLRTLELSERFKKVTTVEQNAPHIPSATPSDRWVPSTVDPILCDATTPESTDAAAQLSQSSREDDTSPFRVIPLV